ncbi:putative transcription factor pap1 protein [Echria macrotheca]|uniref:Transcription factor pap1 protein n=1 Tax=Echria macrotheca TaxID=438768 RepID=A0AAJ0F9U4_9PEZI|nr:putative transcription factor pap1 protein [Echria macrotheca]
MTSTKNPLSADFLLTPQQQNLLFAALTSNRPAQSNAVTTLSPVSFNSFQASPEIDYEYDFSGPDSSFDFGYDADQAKMIGDLPRTTTTRSDSGEAESPDKRSHPDDDEDENNEPKRRESEDKVAKKPGRKPLTTEPSSKRKAQNRAAQRAFRERKEKHLKDLETKVQELEAASQAANHENEKLRAQVDKMTVEIMEYKKKFSTMASGARPRAGTGVFGAPLTSGIGDVNFQFEFPKFGAMGTTQSSSQVNKSSSSTSVTSQSPTEKPRAPSASNSVQDKQSKDDFSNFTTGLFSPALTNNNILNGSRNNSADSQFSTGGATSTSSPSASSSSNMGGPSSSCGTSPEPYTQSPMGFKPVDTLTTIGEEQPAGVDAVLDFDQFANMEMPDFNFLPQNFEFDPQLFGDYREPQESILSNAFDDSLFNDAIEMDFPTPYNMPLATPASTAKMNLIAQIDAAKDADDVGASGQLLTCNKIWEKLQNCPRVRDGEFDLDGLCSDLQKKAKCSGTGAVVAEQDFKLVMKKYLGDKKDSDLEKCTGEMKA